jgi:hypothetical protein
MSEADFDKWRAAVAGADPAKLGIHLDEAWCGYFKVQDRRSDHLKSAPRKRPYIACAIWRDENGNLVAERAKSRVPVDWLWPWCASHPISYETYAYWHEHEKWPEEAEAA